MPFVMDKLSVEQRHRNMAAIRGKDTKPEMIVRRGLWSRGFRYRLNSPRLPGHPDLVLRKYRTCIFVNGCFWHGHHVEFPSCPSCVPLVASEQSSSATGSGTAKSATGSGIGEVENSECCRIPKTNRAFWVAKIRRNQERDSEEQRRLAEMGWHCITVWECELKPSKREATLTSLAFTLNRIWLEEHAVVGRSYPTLEEEDGDYLRAAEEDAE
ncbi:T/G mismatch-specific endonuclease [Prevotella sp. lc2012]|nr:T/G mismatch-specific endonuclease [Prevotella sp. lc2012]